MLNALDGDEDETYEFKMMFADLCAECEQMQSDLEDAYVPQCFDDIFVSIGAGENGGGLLGWDSYEQDYFGIDVPDSYSMQESTKRLMRLTKEQLIECSAACFKVMFSYLGLRHRYDCLKAALDILKDENNAYLKIVKEIEEIYEQANKDKFYAWGVNSATMKLERLADTMPDIAWIQ